jgi:hypothetical protein
VLKSYIQTHLRGFFKYDKKLSLIVALTFVLFLFTEVEKVYLSDSEFFYESLFRFTNIFYILSVLLIFIFFYRFSSFFFFVVITFYLDLFFQLKRWIQPIIFYQNDGDRFTLIYAIVFAILSVILLLLLLLLLLLPRRYIKVVATFLFISYAFTLIATQFTITPQTRITIEPNFRIKTIKNNLYILLFDEYPSYKVYKKYFPADSNSHAHRLLELNEFNSFEGIFSNYTNTERSVTSFLTGTLSDSTTVGNVIEALNNNYFTKGRNYEFNEFSIFDNRNRPNSLVTTQFFRGINSLMSRYVAPYLISLFKKRGVGNFTNYSDYHASLIKELDMRSKKKGRKVFFGHFFTPHYYPKMIGETIPDRISDANHWMLNAITIIHNSDPRASILILSDHGLRLNRISPADHNKNILYYKNISIDTGRLSKIGLYKLFESINWSN